MTSRRKGRPATTRQELLEVLTGEFQPWSAIFDAMKPATYKAVQSALHRLRKEGLVESKRAVPKWGWESQHRRIV